MREVIWIAAFVGSIAFMFSLKADAEGWFLIYTFVFAFCLATVVILI